jgi:hypothetical protein
MNPWDRAAKQIESRPASEWPEIIRLACEEWAHLACENYRHRESVLKGILGGTRLGLQQTEQAAREIPERLNRLIERMEKL